MDKNSFIVRNSNGENISCKLLLGFNYNNKDYVLYTKGESTIIYKGYVEYSNGTSFINEHLNEEEINIIEDVKNKTIDSINNNSLIDFGFTIYNGNKYKVTYNKITGLRSFYELINNEYSAVQGEVKTYLDKKFNETPDIRYLSNGDNPKGISNIKSFFKKEILVNIGVATIAVTIIVSTLAAIDIAYKTDMNNYKQELDQIYAVVTPIPTLTPNYDDQSIIIDNEGTTKAASQIISSIKNNDDISDEFKDILIGGKDLYSDNSMYLDMNLINQRLVDLSIYYGNTSSSHAIGEYSSLRNSITLDYERQLNCSSNELKLKETLTHEFLHVLTPSECPSIAFSEGTTNLLATEYCNEFNNDCYPNQQTCVRILCEIVGPEVIRNAFFTGDYDIVINALSNNDPSLTDNAYRLFKDMDDILICETTIDSYENKDDSESVQIISDNEANLSNAKEEFKDLISTFYELHKNSSIENDLLVMTYFDSLNNTNSANSSLYIDDDTFEIDVFKAYFNKDFIEANKSAIVIYKYNNTSVEEEDGSKHYYTVNHITDENRYINQQTK